MKFLNVNLIISIIIVAMFIIVGSKLNASGNSNELRSEAKYYQEIEANYKSLLTDSLADMGFRNCGVNILSVTDANGRRYYTVNIHHNKINELTDDERINLLNKLSRIKVEDSDSNVEYCFI